MLQRRKQEALARASGTSRRASGPGTRRVLARQGWAGEKVAFLSILQEGIPVVPDVRTKEVLACQNSFSAAC